MIQPIRGDQREVSFTFTAPRYNSDAEIAAVVSAGTNHTILQADLIFDGPSTNEFKLELPEMHVATPSTPAITGFNTIPFSAELNCFKNLNNSTFMSAAANFEALITITNPA